MSRGNDAIPTWSGFNYQGKIMLFYILKLMNQINKEEDGRVYSVNFEEIEDFCILQAVGTSKWILESNGKMLPYGSEECG